MLDIFENPVKSFEKDEHLKKFENFMNKSLCQESSKQIKQKMDSYFYNN